MGISLFFSGGVANTNPAASIGGAISTTLASSTLFGPISDSDFGVGRVLYRCVYAKSDIESNAVKAWVSSETPSGNTTVALGWGAAAIDATEIAVPTESVTPSNVTFVSPSTKGSATSAGLFLAGQYRALWIRYTITPTATLPQEQFVLSVEGDVAGTNYLLMETGDRLMMETGDALLFEIETMSFLLLESGDFLLLENGDLLLTE